MVRFKFMGTAAAEAIPALWCECPLCVQTRINKDKNVRRRASYLIDDDTIIDYGPDINWQMNAFDIDPVKVKQVLITHMHNDHLDPVEFYWRRPGFSHVGRPLDLYGSNVIKEAFMDVARITSSDYTLESMNIRFHELVTYQETSAHNLKIVPMKALHAPGKNAQFFVLIRNGKTILVANDTGFPTDDVWEQLVKFRYDLVSMDCCAGANHPGWPDCHMGAPTNIAFRKRLLEAGCLKEGCHVIATHFSHNGASSHRELEEALVPEGIEVAYDGMDVVLE